MVCRVRVHFVFFLLSNKECFCLVMPECSAPDGAKSTNDKVMNRFFGVSRKNWTNLFIISVETIILLVSVIFFFFVLSRWQTFWPLIRSKWVCFFHVHRWPISFILWSWKNFSSDHQGIHRIGKQEQIGETSRSCVLEHCAQILDGQEIWHLQSPDAVRAARGHQTKGGAGGDSSDPGATFERT